MEDNVFHRKPGGGGVAVLTNGVCFGDESHKSILRNNRKKLVIVVRKHPSYPTDKPDY